MAFVNVPSTESAQYINSQKSEFQDTYYVDNLNTLGASGGGVEVTLITARPGESINNFYPDGPITYWYPATALNGATFDAINGKLTITNAGVYVMDFSIAVASQAGTDANFRVSFGISDGGFNSRYFATAAPSITGTTANVNGHFVTNLGANAEIELVMDNGSGTREQPINTECYWSVLKIG